jgi:YD repeat-containing protein
VVDLFEGGTLIGSATADQFRTTSYAYNGLNQLVQVTMPTVSGTQVRTFEYSGTDLAWATNPENGTVQYQYDGDGKRPHLADDYTWDKS